MGPEGGEKEGHRLAAAGGRNADDVLRRFMWVKYGSIWVWINTY
jgi:hypothetical protein